jgi:hypothetical protein
VISVSATDHHSQSGAETTHTVAESDAPEATGDAEATTTGADGDGSVRFSCPTCALQELTCDLGRHPCRCPRHGRPDRGWCRCLPCLRTPTPLDTFDARKCFTHAPASTILKSTEH